MPWFTIGDAGAEQTYLAAVEYQKTGLMAGVRYETKTKAYLWTTHVKKQEAAVGYFLSNMLLPAVGLGLLNAFFGGNGPLGLIGLGIILLLSLGYLANERTLLWASTVILFFGVGRSSFALATLLTHPFLLRPVPTSWTLTTPSLQRLVS